MQTPQVEGLVLTLVGKRRISVIELTHFEPEDRSTGIFGNYIEVKATDNTIYVLDDDNGWVHPHDMEGDPDWNIIVGTFDASKVWPSQDAPITIREAAKLLQYHGTAIFPDKWYAEQLDAKWGIGLDTELRQA